MYSRCRLSQPTTAAYEDNDFTLEKKEAYPNRDYKELLDLIVVHLSSTANYEFQRPEAVHKARWMSKQLYCYKLVLLQEYLPPGIATMDQLKKMKRLVQFCTFVFNYWWLNCPVAAFASRQDLTLLQNIRQYKEIDECVIKSAEKAFLRHILGTCLTLVFYCMIFLMI